MHEAAAPPLPELPAEWMRPRQILARRDASGCAFVPVSPAFEWHSYHLPMGVDAIVAEVVAAHMAARVRGVHFRCLSFGLDQYRNQKQLEAWGFDKAQRIFGMNFPTLPLISEYAEPAEMFKALGNRLDAVRACGFRHVFVIDHHADPNQISEIRGFCEREDKRDDAPECRVHFVYPLDFKTIRNPDLLWIGGHAGLYETMVMLAFAPQMVDLDELPEGELVVKEVGIHHGKPTIEPKYNPRRAVQAVADALRADILDHLEAFVREQAGL